ncbi:MAG: glycine/betaine/sarcosine/D-proline family reductase selenoprotein B [Deltaproteobacteria bacterium]|nr:glycine/betaine/sarcosine/D-proline family reductase selenoprotein B [Deltaproteobacteria bacterium]
MSKIRVVHYLNQFFGQIGGEEHAGAPPQVRLGAVGPGRLLQTHLGDGCEVVATVICGDNTFAERPEETALQIVQLVREYSPHVLVAGPAFNAGRYGQACGQVCATIQAELGIPALTGMYDENPGVALFRDRVLIVRTGNSARFMADTLDHMATLATRLAAGERIERPAKEGCFAHGLKQSVLREQSAAQRGIDLLLRKLAGEPYQSEISVPTFDQVEPAPPPADLSKALVAVVTDGGLVTKGNPEGMPPGFTDRKVALSITGLSRLETEAFEVYHGGYDTQFVNADPNRLVPLDTLRQLEQEHVIGRLFETVYATAGLGMTLSNARRLGRDIAQNLKQEGVQAVILTST